MNLSKIAIDNLEIYSEPEVDRKPMLRSKEQELVKIISAIEELIKVPAWNTLKSYVFDGVVETIERLLTNEAKKDDPDKPTMARLNGQLIWARKYSDLSKLGEVFRTELNGIRKQLEE